MTSAATFAAMFSHVVIFWVDPADTEKLLEGANKYLKPIPGVLSFHVGKMVGSHRPVVDQTYQVALNLIFADKKAQDDYQVHPMHVEFVEKVFKPIMKRVVVYDFESIFCALAQKVQRRPLQRRTVILGEPDKNA
jgi:hypothetical protein